MRAPAAPPQAAAQTPVSPAASAPGGMGQRSELPDHGQHHIRRPGVRTAVMD